MARFCYLVLAHTGTAAVTRLVRRIRTLSPQADVVVRFGPEADLDAAALREAGAHVVESPLTVEWGTWSQTEAELEGYRWVREHLPEVEHVVVVSGQDYPVRDLARWEDEHAARGADALLEPMTIDPLSVGRRWVVLRGAPMPHLAHRVLAAVAYRLPRVTGGRVHANPSPRAGDTRWWVGLPRGEQRPVAKAALWKVVSARGIDAVLRRVVEETAERDFVRTCRLPDEVYSPTALRAEPGLTIVDGTTSFTSWPAGASSPRWLDLDLVAQAATSGAPFARKLAADAAQEVVDALDAAALRG